MENVSKNISYINKMPKSIKRSRKSVRRKSFKSPRKWSQSYCKKTPCKKMGFSQKASCRPYKNCYR
jgi:hypothetical protein